MQKIRKLFDLAELQASWGTFNRPMRIMCVLVLSLLPVATLFAIGVMGPRLVREGTLLWFGSTANGTLRVASVEQVGTFKYGEPKYRLTLNYTFSPPDGRRLSGTTVRTDIREPPTLKPGDPIGVHYSRANPQRSVADYNLRTDVYALLLFLPFLTVVGLGLPALGLLTLLRAIRVRRRSRPRPTHWVRKAQ